MKYFKINFAFLAIILAIAASAFTVTKSPRAIGDYFGVTSMNGTAYVLTGVRNTCELRDIKTHCTGNSTVCIVKQIVPSPTNPGGYFQAVSTGGFYQP